MFNWLKNKRASAEDIEGTSSAAIDEAEAEEISSDSNEDEEFGGEFCTDAPDELDNLFDEVVELKEVVRELEATEGFSKKNLEKKWAHDFFLLQNDLLNKAKANEKYSYSQ
ncbi:hypothetical protein GPALN_005461 [Globodera pallida]|nr:hypothetical protein GPALN_005461 [Globodera pallida]